MESIACRLSIGRELFPKVCESTNNVKWVSVPAGHLQKEEIGVGTVRTHLRAGGPTNGLSNYLMKLATETIFNLAGDIFFSRYNASQIHVPFFDASLI